MLAFSTTSENRWNGDIVGVGTAVEPAADGTSETCASDMARDTSTHVFRRLRSASGMCLRRRRIVATV